MITAASAVAHTKRANTTTNMTDDKVDIQCGFETQICCNVYLCHVKSTLPSTDHNFNMENMCITVQHTTSRVINVKTTFFFCLRKCLPASTMMSICCSSKNDMPVKPFHVKSIFCNTMYTQNMNPTQKNPDVLTCCIARYSSGLR